MIHPAEGLRETYIEMITRNGLLERAPYPEVKALCFVSADAKATLFAEDTRFERRPKLSGLWVRFAFRDGDSLEGILPHNLLDWPDHGYWITPPRAGPARQRVFIPRLALSGTELLGVIGARGSGRNRLAKGPLRTGRAAEQLPMFDD